MREMVVSFSGIDGAGKTTQINKLIEYCESNNIEYGKRWSKARGTPGIMFLKKVFRRDKKLDTEKKLEYREQVYSNPKKKKLLYVLSMLDLCWYWGIHFRIIRHKYKLLILDRYLWDTYVEISTEFKIENLEKKFLWKIVKFCALKPQKQILLCIPAEESLKRDLLKGEITTDSLEIKTNKIRYYNYLKSQNRWNVVIDSTIGIEETFNKIIESVLSER